MRTIAGTTLIFALALILAACSDPTRDMEKAQTGDAVEENGNSAAETYTRIALTTANTDIQFLGSKVTGSHIGGFHKYEGHAIVEEGSVRQVEVVIDLDSMWSDDKEDNNKRLTDHLKSDDFFDVENHPTARFASTSITARDDGRHDITGNLTMRGTTRSVTFPATVAYTDGKLTVDAEFVINRQDWNIHFAGMQDDLIRDTVGLTLKVNAG